MLYRILGPLEVARDAEPLPLAPRQRVVLSMLLLQPNRVVTVDRLVLAVWGAAPPPTAKEQIRICVSSIRRRLSADGLPNTIVTRPPGYFIQCTAENLDLLAFESLVSSSRAEAARHRLAEAVTAFRSALALWRGKPLSGMNSQLIRSISTTLDERRLAVVEEYVATQLRIGRPPEPAYEHELISELTELVAANPFRERLRVQLMIALHQAGRRAEALEAYRTGRRLFVARLGLEPGEELVRVEQAILRGDPEIALAPAAPVTAGSPAPAVPRLLPPDTGDFVGRAGLVERLREVLTGPRVEAHTVRLAAVHGRPWLGKTSFVVHVAHQVAAEFPDGQLFVDLGGSSGRPLDPGVALCRFLGALGVADTAVPEGTDERVELYRNLLGDRRVLVVLDDAAEERQVLPLLPGNPRCAVVVTSRVRPVDLPGATLVPLGSLSLPNSLALLTKTLGQNRVRGQSADLTRLAELCGGEPLVLRLAAARLAARPHWSVARLVGRMSEDGRGLTELSHGGLDLTGKVRQVYERLGGQAQRLLRRASLLSTAGFGGWACAPMLAVAEDDADDALAELVDAGLLDVERDPDGQARFHLRGVLRTFARERLAEEDTLV
ncbi:AfsR/SARP family transcriptional regulator [Actinophytocola sp.]|uniref:AfsR/SARP family transcriptional regulator n=1 Tax=Actinophytocola sp. TaxID=1872138 RepID=UPI002D6480AD|nr:BTAD domain-containing putative transcriptional regulator [Actinophytocola sp.]HYQ66219.1 BTAD domain-containing putative transcriptional regulator [Actinophytocola sp.]